MGYNRPIYYEEIIINRRNSNNYRAIFVIL